MFSIDGLDTTGIIGFEQALEHNGYLGGGKPERVILGAADADELHWGTGTNLYYAIRFEGSCPIAPGNGPVATSLPREPSTAMPRPFRWVDARSGESVGTGQTDPP